jgi:hypothetical protein
MYNNSGYNSQFNGNVNNSSMGYNSMIPRQNGNNHGNVQRSHISSNHVHQGNRVNPHAFGNFNGNANNNSNGNSFNNFGNKPTKHSVVHKEHLKHIKKPKSVFKLIRKYLLNMNGIAIILLCIFVLLFIYRYISYKTSKYVKFNYITDPMNPFNEQRRQSYVTTDIENVKPSNNPIDF